MLVEIPDLDVIFGLMLAFIGGLFTLFVYSKLKADSASNDQTKADSESLEFYERQLIDLKIKLDAIDLENLSFSQEIPQNVVKNEEKPVQVVEKPVQVVPEQIPVQPRVERTPNMSSGDIVEAVLRLITDRSRTSRDIQITLGKSREHISRTMRKCLMMGWWRETPMQTHTATQLPKTVDPGFLELVELPKLQQLM